MDAYRFGIAATACWLACLALAWWALQMRARASGRERPLVAIRIGHPAEPALRAAAGVAALLLACAGPVFAFDRFILGGFHPRLAVALLAGAGIAAIVAFSPRRRAVPPPTLPADRQVLPY